MPRISASEAAANPPEEIRHGSLVVDLSGNTVSVAGRDVPVTLSEFLLLKELTLHPYTVMDRSTLATVLGVRSFGHDLAPSSPRAVDIRISRLRRKLLAAGYDCIRTMRFAGYRFVPLAG